MSKERDESDTSNVEDLAVNQDLNDDVSEFSSLSNTSADPVLMKQVVFALFVLLTNTLVVYTHVTCLLSPFERWPRSHHYYLQFCESMFVSIRDIKKAKYRLLYKYDLPNHYSVLNFQSLELR